jgi:hypothetical protein
MTNLLSETRQLINLRGLYMRKNNLKGLPSEIDNLGKMDISIISTKTKLLPY